MDTITQGTVWAQDRPRRKRAEEAHHTGETEKERSERRVKPADKERAVS